MKKYLIVLYCLVNIIFTSCEPDVIGEGINLPTIDVGLKVSPDTAYIQLGDTVYLTASVPTTLSNGVKLEDGKAEIALYYGYTPETPITTLNFSSPKEGGDLVYVLYKGSVNIVKDDGMLNRIYAHVYGDSLQLSIAFVPLKKGTYCFQVQSMFYEGSKGKTRTQPIFDVIDYNWSLWQKEPQPNPNDGIYSRTFYFAVTD